MLNRWYCQQDAVEILRGLSLDQDEDLYINTRTQLIPKPSTKPNIPASESDYCSDTNLHGQWSSNGQHSVVISNT